MTPNTDQSTILVVRLSRRRRRREEPGWNDRLAEDWVAEAGPLPLVVASVDGSGDGSGEVSAAVGFVWCKLIDPDSSKIQRHQLQVAVELDARIQVVDPKSEQLVLRAVEGALGLQ